MCATWVFTKMVPSQIIQSSWPTILVLNQLGFRGPILTPKNECHFLDPCRKTWIHLTFSKKVKIKILGLSLHHPLFSPGERHQFFAGAARRASGRGLRLRLHQAFLERRRPRTAAPWRNGWGCLEAMKIVGM